MAIHMFCWVWTTACLCPLFTFSNEYAIFFFLVIHLSFVAKKKEDEFIFESEPAKKNDDKAIRVCKWLIIKYWRVVEEERV